MPLFPVRFLSHKTIVFFAACGLFLLAGCGREEPEADDVTETAPSSETVTEDAAEATPEAASTTTSLKPVLPDQVSVTATPEPTQTPLPAHDYKSMRLAAANLVPDVAFRNLKTQWEVITTPKDANTKVSREKVQLPNGRSATALKITTDQSAEIHMSHPVPADPKARYEFSIWVKQESSDVGQRFFGFYTYNQQGGQIGGFNAQNKQMPPNQHFIAFNHPDNLWRQVTGTLLPSEASPADFPANNVEGRGLAFRISPETKAIELFFLNYYNRGKPVTTWIALPTIAEYK